MAQRILEPGQIETLAQRSIPRVRLPDRTQVFARRAARLRELADASPIADYLRLLARIVTAQHEALAGFDPDLPSAARIALAREHRMPPLHAPDWPRDPRWRDLVRKVADAAADTPDLPEALANLCARLRAAGAAWLDAQADALLAGRDSAVDAAAAPFVMAALQVHWTALTPAFKADAVTALDVPGVCPLCGSLPVASIVAAQAPFQGYRYLHCALCATEWHMVRVQCSHCGADSKHVAYHALQAAEANDEAAVKEAALRAEACDECHSYRKIVYQEKDMTVDPVADDVATLALDVLLAEKGFHRASGNPMLWQAAQD